ncbi:HAD-IB family phosphatase [Natronomonas salina]|uniref:HAD family hydrolase n=1 Tax=Natronomonas salina TaxID=1710540 RepID=UPI0015B78230|nr:HAD-IB family phosphatase [Natronomonas salina]QLD89215.1 HAD-IB family phosphatase [Natronomonas salina]
MLVAFNFDGSLAESDAYALLAEEAGVAGDVASLTEQSRTGDLALVDSIRRRVDYLEGLPELEMKEALDRVALDPGAADLISALQANDHHVAIITAAPRQAVDVALTDAGVSADSVVAPMLDIDQNALTGDVSGRILDATKGELLEEIAVENEIPVDETIAVGSDDNDREMLETATDSVCFNPTSGMEQHCENTVTSMERLHEQFEQRNLV